MRNVVCAAVVCVMTVAMTVGATAQVETGKPGNDYAEADAGALGVEAVGAAAYCAADAGTLGHPDPVAACK